MQRFSIISAVFHCTIVMMMAANAAHPKSSVVMSGAVMPRGGERSGVFASSEGAVVLRSDEDVTSS